ncbi:hypothetical protein HPB51_012157 [Rhipicephalus microplus]|uniref:PiggyBac transposable element-derived protein domain-containing protein n=1 Tax=Rhipicephalus microplus TaxID=6941 RepID=A0A9J6DMJ4_RHIMP|nr:hypothetical protein HPB51_012157 [Rhipicephalus microplus]
MDIACVNSFILYQGDQKENPGVSWLAQNGQFDKLAFREQLIQQILDYNEIYQDRALSPSLEPIRHQPQKIEKSKNCKLCYRKKKVEQKAYNKCTICEVPLCFPSSRNCFSEWHSSHHP